MVVHNLSALVVHFPNALDTMCRRNSLTNILGLVVVTSLLIACTTVASATPFHCDNCPVISVERVIDGDTFVSADYTVRLYGVDTPERGEPCFGEATDRLRELAGDLVRVESGPRQEDRYDRAL